MTSSIPMNLKAIADSGQCFRMNAVTEGRYQLIAHGRVLSLEQAEDLDVRLLDADKADQTLWHDYFDGARDYNKVLSRVDPEDAFLSAALPHVQGLRILRQEPFETLITFILSQRKTIPAIKTAVESLSRCFGEPIGDTGLFAFPTPESLAAACPERLGTCGLGYRSPYVFETARLIASGALDLDALKHLPDDDLTAALKTLPGVGDKVASCVSLFGFGRTDAFPRDVWINRILENYYPHGFDFDRYRGDLGIIQQYLFYFGRAQAKGLL